MGSNMGKKELQLLGKKELQLLGKKELIALAIKPFDLHTSNSHVN